MRMGLAFVTFVRDDADTYELGLKQKAHPNM